MAGPSGIETLAAPLVNLGLLLAVMAHYLKGPLKAFVVERQTTVRAELEAARGLLSEAKAKNEDLTSKLEALSAEVSALSSQAAEDARRAQDRLVQAARQAGASVVADAQAAAGAMRSELLAGLRKEVALRALARAEDQIRSKLTGEERARLRKEFSAMVERSQ